MAECGYLMESEAEAIRLDVKTEQPAAEKQALWAGLKPRRKLRAIVGVASVIPGGPSAPLGWYTFRCTPQTYLSNRLRYLK